jgi:Arc/MetJ-type ribon-helix-helix transcriptional regulator
MNAEPALIKEIDKIVREEKTYSSRNDFVREAIRNLIREYNWLKAKKKAKIMGEKALKKGWNGELLTKKEKEKIANEYLKEKGFSLTD